MLEDMQYFDLTGGANKLKSERFRCQLFEGEVSVLVLKLSSSSAAAELLGPLPPSPVSGGAALLGLCLPAWSDMLKPAISNIAGTLACTLRAAEPHGPQT